MLPFAGRFALPLADLSRHASGVAREYQLHPFGAPAELRIDYARELNQQQWAAVTAKPGPALVLAGAGAGKTRTLTFRVAWLLEHGVPADRILLLTFTNKAAREMMRRVADLIGGELSQLWGGTFHSVGMRILRRHADRLGYRQDFTIADREDAKDLLTTCIVAAGVDPKATRFPKTEVLAEIFSLALNLGCPVPALLERDYGSLVPLTEPIEQVRKLYAERKRTAGLMDFDDLLVLWLRLLETHADLRDFYQRRFQFVLVDEYQDTNTLQGRLLDLLAGRHRNLMAVGDDAQSIYSWRGANLANLLEFSRRFPDAQVFKIETNYRSTPEILALANAAIAANERQCRKQLRPNRRSGARPVLVVCNEASEQAAFVAQRVLELREEGQSPDDMCVLYRSHFHALELQLELTRRDIPFAITSGIRFFEQAHIKDVAAYLKLIVNPADELAFKRLAKMLPGIGSKGADKLWVAFNLALTVAGFVPPVPTEAAESASDNDGYLDAPPRAAANSLPIAPLLSKISGAVPKKTAAAWAQFSATISQIEAADLRNNPARIIRWVVEADYEDYLVANYDNPRNRLDDLEQLANYAQQFTGTADLLTQLALQTDVEAEETANRESEEDEPKLRLSTIHQAKGLEFGTVFVIMLCDGLFPSSRSVNSQDAEEEERRLFYVAVTRAKDQLYLSYPLLRFMQGGGNAIQQASRFLGEVPKELLEEWSLRPSDRVKIPEPSPRHSEDYGVDAEPF
jgi:DNA helicase-2/ATP-dependent DNA helicase PcrA